MGIMLHTATAAHFLVLVDEPEAFLHPPQSYHLGRMLVENKNPDTQIVIATHSADVVRGLLDAGRANVHIVRLTREGTVNRAAVLPAEMVRTLWRDPLLRFSNILDGLFHEAVVVCESDADCRFYGAMVDELTATGRAPQLLFTHCGGKHRMPTVIRALRAVGVPAVAVPDFDVLRETADVQRIVDSLEGDWSVVAADHGIVKAALDTKGAKLDTIFAKQELSNVFETITTPKLDAKQIERLRGVLKAPTGWDAAKEAGRAAVPGGDAAAAADRLLAALAQIGLLVVPVGRLERFVDSVGGHGPAWLAEVYERGLHEDAAATATARVFIKNLLALLGYSLPGGSAGAEPN